MPKINKYQHYNLGKTNRNTVSIGSFLGVDYSSQKFTVSQQRAIDMKNFVYRDGLVQKRHGYEQILLVDDFYYIPANFNNPTQAQVREIHNNVGAKQINGMWAFDGEDGKTHIVAHIGCLMYEISNLDGLTVKAEPITTGTGVIGGELHSLAFEFENFKSSAFVGGKKLWFLGGNKYMCLRYVDNEIQTTRIFQAVENSDLAPIPTTTIAITYKNALVSSRASLDKGNILTKWRKNKLLSGVTKQEDEKTKTPFFEYTLDAPIVSESESDLANIVVTIEERGGIENA